MENSTQQDEIMSPVSTEAEKVEKKEKSLLQNHWVRTGLIIGLVAVVCAGILYFQSSGSRIGIDKSMVSAPQVDLSPTASGQLNEVYVTEGSTVAENAAVAKVGDEIIRTKTAGQIVNVQKDIGKTFNPGQAVVSMIDPKELRVVGTIDENKGLDKITVGQLAQFTVDAYGSKKYEGVVDEVSSTANQTGVVFNISDQRPTQQFDVKVRFDASLYPELKNGMSAKLVIFTK